MDEAKPGLGARLTGIVRRFGGGALAVLGLVLTVYIFWYQEYGKVGEIAVAIKGEGSVLTVQRQIPDLDILYRGASLVGTGKTLRFYSVQISNSGPIHILKTYFDDQVPWGFRLNGAELVQISNVEYKVPALSTTRPTLSGQDSVQLQPVNFDTGEWIRIDFLALTEANAEPVLVPIGRVSGTQLVVRNEIPTGSYIDRAFGGSTLVQLGRMAGYALLLLLTLIAIAMVGVGISGAAAYIRSLPRRRRLRSAEKAGAVPLPSDVSAASVLRSVYVSDGGVALAKAVRFLANEQAVKEAAGRYRSRPERMRERENSNVGDWYGPGYLALMLARGNGDINSEDVSAALDYGQKLIEAVGRFGDPEPALASIQDKLGESQRRSVIEQSLRQNRASANTEGTSDKEESKPTGSDNPLT